VLRVEALEVAYGAIRALKGVALEVGRGQIVALLGSNGAGKTTTLKTISGLVPAARGTITLDGESLVGVPPHAIALRGIAHVPEGRRIFPNMTVAENLALGAYAPRVRPREAANGVCVWQAGRGSASPRGTQAASQDSDGRRLACACRRLPRHLQR